MLFMWYIKVFLLFYSCGQVSNLSKYVVSYALISDFRHQSDSEINLILAQARSAHMPYVWSHDV